MFKGNKLEDNFSYDNNKKIKETPSLFIPDEKTKEATALVLKDFQFGYNNFNRTRREFNDRTVQSEIDVNQRAFNSYVPPKSEDPDESWRAQTVRPVTRNKLISIAAHVTASILYPAAFAQDSNDEEDRLAGEVMRDLIEWNIDNSDYKKTFLNAVITALVDPAVIVEARFAEVKRTIKDIQADGSWKPKEVIDDLLSGFQITVVPCNEILISNIKEPNIQKQRFVIRNRYIDYEEAKVVWGKSENFKYVLPGVRCVFDPATRGFYDIADDELKSYLVNEVTYYNRYKDLQLTFINGILVTDPEQPNTRLDKMYPFAKSGYEPLNNGIFFYYKSAANKLGSDQDIVDTLYNMILDGSFLALMPPAAIYGAEEFNSSVYIPGMVTSFRDPNTKFETIGPRADLRAGMESIQMVENSMSESSQDNLRSGMTQGGGDRTAREVMLLEKNAAIALGLFGKMIGFLVEDIGNLMVSDIIQHMTVAQVSEITGDMKYRSFILPEKIMGGKTVSKSIQFVNPADNQPPVNREEYMDKSFELLDTEGGPESDKRIFQVNPELFRERKYKIKVNVDELTPKSKALEKALSLEFYDRAIQNPLADQEAVFKDMISVYKPGEADKFVAKQQPMPQAGAAGLPVNAGGAPQKGVNTSMLSQITGSNSLGVSAAS